MFVNLCISISVAYVRGEVDLTSVIEGRRRGKLNQLVATKLVSHVYIPSTFISVCFMFFPVVLCVYACALVYGAENIRYCLGVQGPATTIQSQGGRGDA